MAERKMKGLRFQSRRLKEAEKRFEALVKQYMTAGMSGVEARKKAYKELRDDPRSDWRA